MLESKEIKAIIDYYINLLNYVELNAPLDVRIKRNKSDNRLLYKPAKRDIKFNTNISAKETAQIIKEKFNI